MKKLLIWLIWIICLSFINFSSAWDSFIFNWVTYNWLVWVTNSSSCPSSFSDCQISNFSNSSIFSNNNWFFYFKLQEDFFPWSLYDYNIFQYWWPSVFNTCNINEYLFRDCVMIFESWNELYMNSNFWVINWYIWFIETSNFWDLVDINNCPSTEYTQLQCENEYNLIPESSVTSAYCEETFNLIDPESCPSSWWTWDINWSNFFVNSHQINGASNIYLWLPEFLTWDYTYIDNWSTLEIDVENEWNPEYIEDILTVQTYHPSSEDFTQSFTWTLVLLMPYIIITLFIIFVWRLIKRIFK